MPGGDWCGLAPPGVECFCGYRAVKKVCYGGPNTWCRYNSCEVDKCSYEEFYDPPHSARMQTFVSVLWASHKMVGRDYATTRTKLCSIEAENEHIQR